jgi:hypothetical protein
MTGYDDGADLARCWLVGGAVVDWRNRQEARQGICCGLEDTVEELCRRNSNRSMPGKRMTL